MSWDANDYRMSDTWHVSFWFLRLSINEYLETQFFIIVFQLSAWGLIIQNIVVREQYLVKDFFGHPNI